MTTVSLSISILLSYTTCPYDASTYIQRLKIKEQAETPLRAKASHLAYNKQGVTELNFTHFRSDVYTSTLIPALCYDIDVWNINNNSVALVQERTTLIERPPLVGEISANFCGEGATWSAWLIPTAAFSYF
jgi:hypothetical protein